MALDFVLDNLDSVEDEKIKALYKEDGGRFKLDLDLYAEHVKAPVVAKNKDFQKRLEKAKPFADKFKDVSDDDWTAYQEWKTEHQDDDDDEDGDKGKKPDDGKGKPDSSLDPKKIAKQVRAELKQEFDAQLKAKDDEIAKERAKFDDYRFDQELTGLALENDVIGARLRKFKAAAVSEGIFAYREGKLVALDEDGEPSTETPAERMTKLAQADEWKFFFGAKEVGGGSGKQKQGAVGHKELKRSKMTNKEKSDYIKEHGNAAFLKLPL
jgi:hypothetical protein